MQNMADEGKLFFLNCKYYFVFQTSLIAIFEIVNHPNAKINFLSVLTWYHNMILKVKDSDGIYDPVLYLSYSKMKETVSKFPFAISYRPNIRILARNHGILERVLKFSWIYIVIRLLNCYTETTCFELFIWSSEIQHSDWSSKWFNNLRLWITNINANFIQMKKLFAF